MKEKYTKIGHTEAITKREHTEEKVVIVDNKKQFEKQQRWNLLTLKLKYIVPIIFFFASFVLSVILLVLRIIIPTDDMFATHGVVQWISENNRADPIADIAPISGSQICDDLSYETVTLGKWGGTRIGCRCVDEEEDVTITRGDCSESEFANGCTTYEGAPDIRTYTWNGDRFCVRFLTDYSRTTGSCSGGATKCASNICVQDGDPCPISDVQILDQADATPSGYTERLITRDRKLVFINDGDADTQFIGFYRSTDRPCLNRYVESERDNGESHPIEFDYHIGCGDYGEDEESVLQDQITENEFYTFNYLISQVEDIPNFVDDVIADNKMTLNMLYRFQTSSNNFCAGLSLNDATTLLYDLEEHSKVYLIIGVGAVLITLFSAIVGCVYIRVFQRLGLYIANKEEPFGRRFIVYVALCNGIFHWVTLYFGDETFSKFSDQKSYIGEMADANCFTSQEGLNEAVSTMNTYLGEKTDGFRFIHILLVFISAGSVFVTIALNLWRRGKKWDPPFWDQRY